MKALVTGGAGFIGSGLIRLWLKADPSVRIVNLDKLTYCGDLSRLQDIRKNPRYLFLRGDVCRPRDVERAMDGCEVVVHLAAETHVDRSLLDARDFLNTNIYGTYVLLEVAKRKGVGRFVHVSTDEVYGSRDRGFFTEKDPLAPTSPYSVSKTAADFLALSYAHTHQLPVVVTRGSNTFGPYQYPEKVIPLFATNALSDESLPLYGDGLQVRNWIYADDHARAILHALEKGKAGHAYNISSENSLTNIDLTRRILKILGKPFSLVRKVKDRPGHDRRYAIDSGKLRRLGWKEKARFDDALEATVLWYRDHEAWWRRLKEKGGGFAAYYKKAYAPKF